MWPIAFQSHPETHTPAVNLCTPSGHHLGRGWDDKMGVLFAGCKIVTEQKTLVSFVAFHFPPCIKSIKDILGLYGVPNQIFWQRDCCFWKAVLIAKYPVKMQNSSQTKDLIKDHFSFTAFFLQPLQCIVSSMVLQSPCHCLEFTGCSNIYREYRHRALNTVFQPAPSMIHRMEFFMSWNWPLKQNLYCLLFTIFHTLKHSGQLPLLL